MVGGDVAVVIVAERLLNRLGYSALQQLIAAAIAAFQHNMRVPYPDLKEFGSMVIPAIAVWGSLPIFYKIKAFV
ncbi:hypothetical protein K438DRAFT_2013050 [Mycena galopus ATCC 62051]|nr:hypothetical protein K438DRAFT_2013050 [Mycena galopus ATCC 62051]